MTFRKDYKFNTESGKKVTGTGSTEVQLYCAYYSIDSWMSASISKSKNLNRHRRSTWLVG